MKFFGQKTISKHNKIIYIITTHTHTYHNNDLKRKERQNTENPKVNEIQTIKEKLICLLKKHGKPPLMQQCSYNAKYSIFISIQRYHVVITGVCNSI